MDLKRGRISRRFGGFGVLEPDPMSASPSESNPAAAQSSEEALIATRRAKAEAARSRAENPFPNDLDTSDRSWLGPLRQRFESALVDSTEQRYDAVKFANL